MATIPLLRYGTIYSYANLNQAVADGESQAMWGERLLRIGPDGQAEPWLARSVTQQSPTVCVYHLRHGVPFWDGNEMTSADVVNALKYASLPTTYIGTSFTNVSTITAKDKYTVVITLKRPDASWPPTLGTVGVIFEKKFQQKYGAKMGQPGVLEMETGPYEPQSFDPTTHFQSACGRKVVASPGDTSADVVMNVTMPPFNNIHVRRAIAYAIDRPAEVAESADPSTPDTANSILTPAELGTLAPKAQVTALLDSLPNYPYNLAKAKAELAQSPYPHGFTTTAWTLQCGTYTPETPPK